MLNCALVLPDRLGNPSLVAALKMYHTTSFDMCARNAAWPRHHGRCHPISSCISGPTDMSRSEYKAETTCAEPPDNAATSLDTSRHVSQKLSHVCCSGMHPGTKHHFFSINKYDTHYKLYSLSNICI